MKSIRFNILSILLLTVPLLHICGQEKESPGDKFTLLTMPFNQRPLNSYMGQLQISAGYEFAVRSRSYDADGKKTSLKDLGIASIGHYYFMDIKYGVTNFFEVEANVDYLKSGTKSGTVYYYTSNLSGGTDIIPVYTLDETKGFGDLCLSGALRLPFDYKWFDLKISGGCFLPIAPYKPPVPTSSVTDVLSENSYTVNYHNNYRNGYGVPVLHLVATGKASLSKFTALASYTFDGPAKEGASIRWNQALENQSFTFSSTPYKYLLARTNTIDASVHYQATGWLDINLNLNLFHASKGWTEYLGKKYSNPEQKLIMLQPRFEMQVSPFVRIYEIVGLPLSGKNTYGPFYIYTTFSFNLFPFRKF
jgi:hypothetical protein